jgi:hypothetical protein
VGNHAADGAPEHLGGSAEVEGSCARLARPGHAAFDRNRVRGLGIHTTASGVVTGLLAHEGRVLHCVSCQASILISFPVARRMPKAQDTLRDAVDSRSTATTAASSQRACPLLARSWSGWVGRRTLGAEELAGDVEGLAAHNDNLLSVEQLLSDGAGEATEQVPLAVDDLIHKSARGSRAIMPADRGQRSQREIATANLG